MIKIENEKCVISGTPMEVLIELTSVVEGCYGLLLEYGFEEKDVKNAVYHTVEFAFEQLKEDKSDIVIRKRKV